MKAVGIAAIAVTVCVVWVAANAGPGVRQVKSTAAPEVAIADLPGITTPDRTPHACVDCHVNDPKRNVDFRLPSILAKWKDGADPRIVEKAQAAAPAGRTLTGRHPDVSAQIRIIPNDCLGCHMRDSQMAPPFAKLLHAIHLVGGRENPFLTIRKGTCTSCHKLDQKTGAWHIGSGPAK